MMVPPMLEAALGCFSARRFLLFYISPKNDTAWTDGEKSCQVYWPSWLLYSNSPKVSLYLRHHALTYLNVGMSYGLVLDRNKRRFSIDSPICISGRMQCSIDDLIALRVQNCMRFALADEMTLQIAKYMY